MTFSVVSSQLQQVRTGMWGQGLSALSPVAALQAVKGKKKPLPSFQYQTPIPKPLSPGSCAPTGSSPPGSGSWNTFQGTPSAAEGRKSGAIQLLISLIISQEQDLTGRWGGQDTGAMFTSMKPLRGNEMLWKEEAASMTHVWNGVTNQINEFPGYGGRVLVMFGPLKNSNKKNSK